MVGAAFTVTTYLTTSPAQPFKEGVIEKVTVPATLVEFKMVTTGNVFEVPEGTKPVIPGVAAAVQEYVTFGRLEVNVTKSVLRPEQIVWANAVFVIIGTGFMAKVVVAVAEEPQSFVTTRDTV